MYAVFQTGSKQYRVSEGHIIHVERMDSNIGDSIEFNKILLVKDDNDVLKVGNPFVINVKIIAQVIAHRFYSKIKIIKFRRRKHFRKCQGHRQSFTLIKIKTIHI